MKISSDKNVVEMFNNGNSSAKTLLVSDAFDMMRGGHLHELNIAYETFGKLNKEQNNVVVICNTHLTWSS